MKKHKLLIIIALLVASPIMIGDSQVAQATEVFQSEFKRNHVYARLVKEMVGDHVIRMDYNGRTDGQPVYVGYAVKGSSTSEDVWLIYQMTYDGNNQLTLRVSAYGNWDGRAGLTYN